MSTELERRHDLLRARLGVETSEVLGVIDARDLRRFAIASSFEGDIYGGEDDDELVAPPLYLSSVMGWGAGPPERELAIDGTSEADTRGIPLTGVRLMGAGQELEFHAPMRPGVSVVVHTSLVEVTLKEGSGGQFLLLRINRRFTDEDGDALVTCVESFIAR